MYPPENIDEFPLLRVGIQTSLNTKPLYWRLKEIAPDMELKEGTPRDLSNLLTKGELDVALVPLLTILRNPDLSIIPKISVTSRGLARNSILFSKVAPADIKTVLVDRSSVDSIALLRALFNIRWSAQPVEVLSSKPLMPDYPFMSMSYDAFLMIGDSAMQVRTEFPYKIDLGEQWQQWTNLPFVFSVWGVKAGLEGPALEELFLQAKEEGIGVISEIVKKEHGRLGLNEHACLDILYSTIYDLGEEELKGIERFHFFMEELRICEPYIELKFYGGDQFQIHPIGKKP